MLEVYEWLVGIYSNHWMLWPNFKPHINRPDGHCYTKNKKITSCIPNYSCGKHSSVNWIVKLYIMFLLLDNSRQRLHLRIHKWLTNNIFNKPLPMADLVRRCCQVSHSIVSWYSTFVTIFTHVACKRCSWNVWIRHPVANNNVALSILYLHISMFTLICFLTVS